MQGNETIYLAGCFGKSLPWKIISGAHNIPEQDIQYSSNASEANLIKGLRPIMLMRTFAVVLCDSICVDSLLPVKFYLSLLF